MRVLLLIIVVILGSSVVATIVAKIFDIITEKKRKEERQYQKLYGPLKFYLAVLDANKSTKDELQKANEENYETITQAISDNRKKMEILITDRSKFHTGIISSSIIEWWLYVDKIKEVLKRYPEYIKNEHWELVKKFIKNYMLRQLVVGKNIYIDTSSVFPSKTIEQAFEGLHDVIEEMKKKIL